MSERLLWKVAAAILLVAILAGCSASPTQAPATAAPTSTPINLEPTFQAVEGFAVQTMIANLTQNAPTATNTSEPTLTPTITDTPLPPTITPTATHVFIPWTPTPNYTSTPQNYGCAVTSVSPSSTDKKTVGEDFDGKWTVKNTGTKTWIAADLDVHYISGTKFQKKTDVVDLPGDVAPNGTETIVVDMMAPSNDGTYSTVWGISLPDGSTCTLNMTLNVTK